jgi:hypothetical protein
MDLIDKSSLVAAARMEQHVLRALRIKRAGIVV